MKGTVFMSVLVTCFLHSVTAVSIKTKEATLKPQDPEFFFELSSSNGKFYQATSVKEDNFTKWEVTEKTLPETGAASGKTCMVEYDTKKNVPGARSFKPWSSRKLLLVELVYSNLLVHHTNMETCEYKMISIPNVDEFQVYVVSDNQYDIFWTSDNPKLKDFIMVSEYTVGGAQTDARKFARRPDSKNWEALLLGKAAFYRETRKKSEDVVSLVRSEHNMTDLMKIGVYDESHKVAPWKYLISSLHNELGVCVVVFNKYFICRKYDNNAMSKLNFTMISDDLKHPVDSQFESNLVLHNLEDGGLVILFIDSEPVENDPESQLILGFTPLVVHPNGQYSDTLKVEFEDSKFKCSTKVDERGRSQVSILTNVVELRDSYCFQFLCSEPKKNSHLYHKKKCLVKESMGGEPSTTPKPTPKPNGAQEFSGASVWLLSLISLILVNLLK